MASLMLLAEILADSDNEENDGDTLCLSWILLQSCEALDLLPCGVKRRRLDGSEVRRVGECTQGWERCQV
jgi:hypothetical protein